MNTDTLDTASRFLQAAASYWGIPPDQLIMGKQGGSIGGVFSLQLTIALTPGDLVGITHRMHQMAEDAGMREPQAEEQVQFVADDPLQLAQWRDDYSALSPQEKGKYKSFQRYKAHRQAEALQFDKEEWAENNKAYHAMLAEESEGVGGRKVQHVDVAEEPEADAELPATVWVHGNDLSSHQLDMASDRRHKGEFGTEFLVQVDMLTPEQKAKYCGEQKP